MPIFTDPSSKDGSAPCPNFLIDRGGDNKIRFRGATGLMYGLQQGQDHRQRGLGVYCTTSIHPVIRDTPAKRVARHLLHADGVYVGVHRCP